MALTASRVDLRPFFLQQENNNETPFLLTLHFDVWIPSGAHYCLPSSISLVAAEAEAAAQELTIPLALPEGGWKAGKWNSVQAPVASPPLLEEEEEGKKWEALARLEMGYECEKPLLPPSQEQEQQEQQQQYIKLELVRLCKALPSPSICTVVSTDAYKTDCHECNCQTCHKDGCGCVTILSGQCPFDECRNCLCAPFCKCCYEAACDYRCNCETCCESRSFTSCADAVSYEVAELVPAAGGVEGGAHVVVTSTSTFVETPEMACRFGEDLVVPATLLTATTLACVAPAFNNKTTESVSVPVSVEVSLDGGQQWTNSGHIFYYCPADDVACLQSHNSCPPGWVGEGCDVECAGGAVTPCHGNGFCLTRGGEGGEEGTCRCKPGFEGLACEKEGTIKPAAASPKGDKGEEEGRSTAQSSAMRQGLALGVGVSFMLLAVAGVAVYMNRAELGEYVFWALASTRFERLHRPGGDSVSDAAAEEGRGGRGGRVELTHSSPANLPIPSFLRHQVVVEGQQQQQQQQGHPVYQAAAGYNHHHHQDEDDDVTVM